MGTDREQLASMLVTNRYEFTIPANASATVELTTASAEKIRVNGMDAAHAVGVSSAKTPAGKVALVVGSGHYIVTAP